MHGNSKGRIETTFLMVFFNQTVNSLVANSVRRVRESLVEVGSARNRRARVVRTRRALPFATGAEHSSRSH